MKRKALPQEIKDAIDSVTSKCYDDNGHLVSTSFGLFEAAEAVQRAQEKICLRNKDQIDALKPKLAELDTEINSMRAEVDKLNAKIHKATSQQKRTWREVAADLGLKPYLTANGQLSRAQVVKRLGKDAESIQAVLNTYNKEYVPQVNAAMKEAAKPYALTDKERALQTAYNAKAAEYNRLANKMRELSGIVA